MLRDPDVSATIHSISENVPELKVQPEGAVAIPYRGLADTETSLRLRCSPEGGVLGVRAVAIPYRGLAHSETSPGCIFIVSQHRISNKQRCLAHCKIDAHKCPQKHFSAPIHFERWGALATYSGCCRSKTAYPHSPWGK
jgi:hypothetical protein